MKSLVIHKKGLGMISTDRQFCGKVTYLRHFERSCNQNVHTMQNKFQSFSNALGLDPDFDDFNIDIMAYCTSSCYAGFGDDEGCFYPVYR